jgi:hypothetical protein
MVRGDTLRLSAPQPLPEQLLAELRQHKGEILELLRAPQRARAKELRSLNTVPAADALDAWCAGVASLAAMRPPRDYPPGAWKQLIGDAERFLQLWSIQAMALGWQDWELFGCHRRAPWGQIQGMGLVLLLRNDEIAALTATEAVIRTRTDAHQTYRRKSADPLHPADRCLVWELQYER